MGDLPGLGGKAYCSLAPNSFLSSRSLRPIANGHLHLDILLETQVENVQNELHHIHPTKQPMSLSFLFLLRTVTLFDRAGFQTWVFCFFNLLSVLWFPFGIAPHICPIFSIPHSATMVQTPYPVSHCPAIFCKPTYPALPQNPSDNRFNVNQVKYKSLNLGPSHISWESSTSQPSQTLYYSHYCPIKSHTFLSALTSPGQLSKMPSPHTSYHLPPAWNSSRSPSSCTRSLHPLKSSKDYSNLHLCSPTTGWQVPWRQSWSYTFFYSTKTPGIEPCT